MATKFYLNSFPSPYSPAPPYKGSWDDTGSAPSRQLAIDKLDSNIITSVTAPETTATVDWDVMLFRGISGPVAAQTISGTLDVMLGVNENLVAADLVYHVHVWVTQGDSNTVRGTLLADYVETTANEWAAVATNNGQALASAQTVTNVVCSAGDRIVLEVGYRAKNTLTTNFTGALRYGGGPETSDLTAGGNSSTLAGFITFGTTVTLAPVAARVAQALVEGVVTNPSVAAQMSQSLVEAAVSRNVSVAAQVSQSLVEVVVSGYVAFVAHPRTQIVIVG